MLSGFPCSYGIASFSSLMCICSAEKKTTAPGSPTSECAEIPPTSSWYIRYNVKKMLQFLNKSTIKIYHDNDTVEKVFRGKIMLHKISVHLENCYIHPTITAYTLCTTPTYTLKMQYDLYRTSIPRFDRLA